MVGTLTTENTVDEALDHSDSCKLVSCDGSEASLSFRQLQASLQGAGLNAQADAPNGMSGEFNAKTAAADTKAPATTQPDMAPDLVMQQQQAMNLSNG